MGKQTIDRRSFLKGAAATAAAATLGDQELVDMYAYLASIKSSPAAKDLPLPNF